MNGEASAIRGRLEEEMKMNVKRKFVSTVLAVGVLGGSVAGAVLASGGIAMAAGRTVHGTTQVARDASRPYCFELSALVNAGTISQTQASAVRAAMITYMESVLRSDGSTFQMPIGGAGGVMRTVLSSLVSNGTITQTQADAIVNSMLRHGMMGDFGATGGYGYGGMMGGAAFSNGTSRYGGGMMGW